MSGKCILKGKPLHLQDARGLRPRLGLKIKSNKNGSLLRNIFLLLFVCFLFVCLLRNMLLCSSQP